MADPALVRAIAERFTAAADPERAPAMRSYMRDQFGFLGITSSVRTELLRAAIAEVGAPTDADGLLTVTHALWRRPEREYRYAACSLLRRGERLLRPGDLADLGRFVTTDPWWDTVDELAQHPVGSLVRRDPELRSTMDAWLVGDDLWLTRTAILHQNRWKADTDADWLFTACLARAGDTDFFIRKAIGWALRQYAYVDPEAVRGFVAAHRGELSPLSVREASKHL